MCNDAENVRALKKGRNYPLDSEFAILSMTE